MHDNELKVVLPSQRMQETSVQARIPTISFENTCKGRCALSLLLFLHTTGIIDYRNTSKLIPYGIKMTFDEASGFHGAT